MEKRKCPKCNLVNWSSSPNCRRCSYTFSENYSSAKFNNIVGEAQSNDFVSGEKPLSQEVKSAGWKKIKWGVIVSIIGFAITVAFFASGLQTRRVGLFAIITLTPIAAVLAGVFEVSTGISILDVVEKWEKLPQWQGWLIGFLAFFVSVFLLLAIITVVILNFF